MTAGAAVLGVALASAPSAKFTRGAQNAAGAPIPQVAQWTAELDGADPLRQEAARRHLFANAEAAIPALASGLELAPPRAQAARLALLAALSPGRTLELLPAVAASPHPAVRKAAAVLLALGDAWPPDLVRALLADDDPHVGAALLDALGTRTLPRRRRFAAAFGAELEGAFARGDPRARTLVLPLLVLDDDPAAAARARRILAAAAPAERERFLAELVARPPEWEPSHLAALVREHASACDGEEPASRMLKLHARLRFDPDARAGLDEAALRELLRLAGRPPDRAQEHAAAAIGVLGPTIGVRLNARLREIEDDAGFDGALEIQLRLRGAAGVDSLLERLVEPDTTAATAARILAVLARLSCEAMARRLDEKVAPRLAPAARPALAEAALRMPPCEPRNRLLLNALRDLRGDARLRPFEALARTGDGALLGFLLDALEVESDPRVRGRMIEQIAESFGASDPEEVLAMVRAQLASARPTDRLAALEGVPFVALGARTEEVALELAARFAESEPEALLHVLAQIGGDVAERVFADLAARLARDPQAAELQRFLLSRAGRLRGGPTRALLLAALDDPRPRLREAALRALIERGDPAALERTPAVLAGLDPGTRVPLLTDFVGLRHLDGFAPLLRRLFLEAQETAARLALLELAEPMLRDFMVPWTLSFLDSTADPDERHAALAALGRLGGAEARARLDAHVEAALALDDEQFHEGAAVFAEGRTALLAWAGVDTVAATPRLATMLLRAEAARTGQRVARAALGLPAQAPLADPALIEALAARPAADAIGALEAAWRALGPAADLCDERFFAECAEAAARAGAPPELCEWFDERVLALWPRDSAADFRALLPPGRRREILRRAALADADAALLADAPRIVATLARGAVSPREAAEALGRGDPLLGVAAARTLDVLATLAEAGAGPGSSEALAAAAREARECPRLLRAVLARAERERIELPNELSELAASPAPLDADLAALRRALDEMDRR